MTTAAIATRAEELLAAFHRQADAERRADRSILRFDAHGDVIEIREADGEGITFEYDANRRLVRAGDAYYRYGDNDRLGSVERHGVRFSYEHDTQGRVVLERRGNAGAVVYRYDDRGRMILGRTATISTEQEFDSAGRIVAIRQIRDGVTIAAELEYDARGRLLRLALADCETRYFWDDSGAPVRVEIGPRARVEFDSSGLSFSNGVCEQIGSSRTVWRGDEVLWSREYAYGTNGLLEYDGERRYEYDAVGQLIRAEERGVEIPLSEGTGFDGWTHRFNDTDQLTEVRYLGNCAATFEYDHKGRLAVAGDERYLYGPMDELLAVTDRQGCVRRAYVHTVLGCLAEVRDGRVYFLHNDERGTCRIVTDEGGNVAARFAYQPFGAPAAASPDFRPVFGGHVWHADVRLHYCGARWYDPAARRFLTPDTYTARPDDARLVNPVLPASQQAGMRSLLMAEWAKQPRARDRFAYCGNDPVNQVDPSGHWSFGGVLLMLLGVIWSMPNTLLALAIEITCIAFEPIRALVSVFRGHPRFTVGFDAGASSRLSTFAIAFRGGWFGSFDSMLAFTFGNIFFLNQDWESNFVIKQPGDVQPLAYNGAVTLTRKQALFEHMLRHTNQCSWFGPFFHLGVPLFGFYWWFRWLGGGAESWFERDAREHGGV
jgi:RHS repeat-associated protein